MSKKSLRIDIVSDVVCPWCIVGYKRLQAALEQVQDEVEADIHWHPFELNPNMAQGGENLREHLAAKYGSTEADSKRNRENLTAIGKQLDFQFDFFDDMRMYNTFKAHQLLHFAREHNKEMALKLRLFSAFFSEQKVIESDDVLVAEAKAVGLDADESRAVLQDQRYDSVVREEQQFWTSRGVQAVPTFVFNNEQGVSGAHEPDTLAKFMREIA